MKIKGQYSLAVFRNYRMLFISAALGACVNTAYAADEQSTDSWQVEEIIVTATKRAVNVQDTSIAITALTGSVLEDRVITNAMELDKYVPNLLASPGAAASPSAVSFTIRGIGQVDFITTTESGVGVYLDGVYLSRTTGSAIELTDIERIEVLRGPQGTLFGRNAVGGAVSIVTKKPDSEEFSGRVSVAPRLYSTDDIRSAVDGKLSLNVPLSDKLAARISVLGKTSEGWGKNVAAGRGEGLGEEKTIAGRLALRYQPNDIWTFDAVVDFSHNRGTIAPQLGIAGPLAPAKENPLFAEMSAPTDDDRDAWSLSFTAEGEIGENVYLRSISAYNKQDGKLGQDSDGSTLTFIDQLVVYNHHQLSQEIQLFGDALDERLEWLVGAFYFKEEGEFFTTGLIANAPIKIDTFSNTKSLAGFANLTYKLTDELSLLGGFRYSNESKFINAETFAFGALLIPAGDRNLNFDKLTFKAGFEYSLSDTTLIYGVFAQGFRSGGFNGRPLGAQDLEPFGSETNNSYELGMKSDFFDRRLRLNLAAFYTRYQDIQLTAVRPDPVVGVAVLTANAGVAKLPGFEAEAQWAVNENLELYASIGYLDNDGVESKPGFTLAGDTLPLSSRVNTVFGFQYKFPAETFDASIGFDWNYRSKYYQSTDNAENIAQDGYHQFGVRFNLRPIKDSPIDLTIFVKNLTNKQYRIFGQDSTAAFGTAVVTLARPREIGLILRYDF